MPARIWWVTTILVSLVFALSLWTEAAGLTTFCGLNRLVATLLLAVPTALTTGCAVVATYRESLDETSRIGHCLTLNASVA